VAGNGKTVIIGLDGVPFGMIKDFAETGVMPNTAELISQGIFKKMHSSIPEVSSVAWSSIITGNNPGEHGIFGFMDLLPDSYKMRFPNFSDLKAPPFWDQWEGKSVIINVPSVRWTCFWQIWTRPLMQELKHTVIFGKPKTGTPSCLYSPAQTG
jgi:predicted AlkP superfamily phosphohydrolase/phosphomutase